MLTARIEDSDKIIGLELGADDYITKPFNPREVVARVRAVLRRTQAGSSAESVPVLEWGAIRLDVARRMVTVSGQSVDLTPTEFDILRTLMENPGYVFTRSSLIERSLGYDYESLERTLDTHIKNLRRKIEPDPRQPVYIQTVYGVGYRLEKPPT
jgi:two-component system alkaline phosphatase synthesis response regulator PhoP